MGASPEQLEREIEQTRADLAHTIGRIEECLAPRNVLRRHKQTIAVVCGGVAALITVLMMRRVRR